MISLLNGLGRSIVLVGATFKVSFYSISGCDEVKYMSGRVACLPVKFESK